MNTPNLLTILRMVLVPVFMVFMLYEGLPYAQLIGAVIFVWHFLPIGWMVTWRVKTIR